MNCLECRELLHKRLDGEVVAAEALEQHLNQCAVCREQHAGALLLLDGLKQMPDPQLAAGFAQSMVAQVMRDRQHRQQKMRRRVFATMALAASIVIMLMLAYYWLPRSGSEGPVNKDKLVKDLPKNDGLPHKQPDEPKDPKKLEPHSPLTALTDRWAETTRDHAKVMVAGVREAGQEVTDDVRTVTRSARKAFDFFAREFPMRDERKDPKKLEPRSPLTALTDRWAETTRDHAKVVVVAANLDGADKLPPVDALPVNAGVREAGQEVTDGVRTVTRSARNAFDFFARELPMPDVGAN